MTPRIVLLMMAGTVSAVAADVPTNQPATAEKLPPVRQITHGPQFHWFGYYDKFQFDPTDRYVLGNEVAFEHRSPTADDVIKVGMVDLQDGDRWIELGETRAWNWQQGCMLQWVPGTESTVMWNDREGDHFVCRVLDVKTRQRRTLPNPVYCLSPDGRWGLAPDFRRLNDCRPGYGYTGLPDPNADEAAPTNAGIWRVDLQTGEAKLLLSFAQIAAFPFKPDVKLDNDPARSKHWFNHLLISPDGKRFIFLHRWRQVREGQTRQQFSTSGFSTRLFTANADGTDLQVVDPYGRTSHFIWRDPEYICAWAWHPSNGARFYLYRDRNDAVEVVGKDMMVENGHNTYLPGTSNEWILNDTYPDAQRLQHPYLYHIPGGKKLPLGHFLSPAEYAGEWRCDTHPRASRSGRYVCIDSPHNGGRQMYLIEVPKL